LQTLAEALLQLDLLLEVRDLELEHAFGRDVRPAQEPPDLLQGESQVAKRLDLLQADHVASGVETVTCRRALRRRQQTHLVVVMERPHGHPCPSGQLAHFPGRRPHAVPPFATSRWPGKEDKASRYVRVKGHSEFKAPSLPVRGEGRGRERGWGSEGC